MEDGEVSAEERLSQNHRRERKELQGEIQRLKHAVPKGDKKQKREVMVKVAQLEAELDERQTRERAELKQVDQVTQDLADTTLAATVSGNHSNHVEDQGQTKKLSKAQKRRDRKALEEREREERIKNQDVENLSGARHLEAKKLKAVLAARNLCIHEIPSDGNCLYAAISDQLSRQGQQENMTNLRAKTADYMRSHRDDFIPFLCKPDTGDPYSLEEYDLYCDRLENTPEWGGQLELRSLASVLEKPIEVIQADAPAVLLGEEYNADKLILSYHRHIYGLGEHYNSVVTRTQVPEDKPEDFT